MEDKTLDFSKYYEPYPMQKKFHESDAPYRLYGGAAGGGKTQAVIFEAAMRSLAYPFPVNGAIFRNAFPDLDRTIIRTMLEIFPGWSYKYNAQKHVWTWYNGSVIDFCYAGSDKDITDYKSNQWDFVGWDELTESTEYQFLFITGSRLRSTRQGVKPKFFAGTNPNGVGHSWCKSRWIEKDCDQAGYSPADYEFFPARVTDNKILMDNDPDYVGRLKTLPEDQRDAMLYGKWDLYAGRFFTEWNDSVHISPQFTVPDDWPIFMSWDEGGERSARAVYLAAIDPDNHVWIIWEYWRKDGKSLYEAGKEIRKMLESEPVGVPYWNRIQKCIVDSQMRAVSNQTGTDSVGILEDMGFGFRRGSVELAHKNRVEGWRTFKDYLSHKPYEQPAIKFFDNCTEAIRTIPELSYYKARDTQETREDIARHSQDDAADAIRYLLVSLERRPNKFKATTMPEITSGGYKPHTIWNQS